MSDQTRRRFLGALGVSVLPGLTQTVSGRSSVGRFGAATASPGQTEQAEPQPASDYLFAPGLTYLNTASLGPTPRAVQNRTLEAWRELESNPTAGHKWLMGPKHGVIIKMIEKRWFNGIRLSPHIFNTEADVDTALLAIRGELS